MLSAKGFAATWKFMGMFRDGLICTVSLSALTVLFGFILALLLAVMRLSDFRPFRALGLTKDGKLYEACGRTYSVFTAWDKISKTNKEKCRFNSIFFACFNSFFK